MNIRYSIRFFFRNLMRRKLFSFINITGLAFGVGFIVLIGQFLYFEFGYNKFYDNIDGLYRLVDVKENSYDVDYRVRDKLVEAIPEIKNACLLNRFSVEVNHDNHVYEFENMLIVDSSFFEVFSVRFVQGAAENAFNTVDNVVLTETAARRIFGETDPVGQSILLRHEYEMNVTAVVKDFPNNSSFQADLLVSAENTRKNRLSRKMTCLQYDGKDDSQCKFPFDIFVELHPEANLQSVEERISSLLDVGDFRFPSKMSLTPLKTNYFNREHRDSNLTHGNPEMVKILSSIGLFILALAVINFVNLTTAGYKYRLTEIGVKKCLGVSARALKAQLLVEALLNCLLASCIGIMVAELFLPHFNGFLDKPLQIQIFTDARFAALFAMFVVFLSLIAGFLPAMLLSKISPLHLFKPYSAFQGGGKIFRNALTTFQFAVAIALVCTLLVMSEQIDYVKHKDLGFDTEYLLNLKVGDAIGRQLNTLMNKLEQYHGIKALSATLGIPGKVEMTLNGYKTIAVDASAVKTFGFKIVQGRNLLPGDLNKACLINTAALANFKDGDFHGKKIFGVEVVGVVSDFHYSSLYEETGPMALAYVDLWGKTHLTIRVAGPVGEAMAFIKKTWMETCPDYPFEPRFYDDYFESMYINEEKLSRLIAIFSILAVVISCLGIFGLAFFQSEQRVKEIGIRKVLGASVYEIVAMLAKNFTLWVVLANVVAWPVVWYAMNKWLQNFAYRIEIGWWIFALAGGLAFVIALLTVSTQAIKAALANPVEVLRYE